METKHDGGVTAVSRGEWQWAGTVAVIVMVLTLIPYLVAAFNSTPDWHFSGHLIGVKDGNTYIAKMLSGAHGAWLLQLPYSPEPHLPAPIYLPYIWLGKLVGLVVGRSDAILLHHALVLAFHGLRVMLGLALVLVAYRFMAEFTDEVRLRRLGTVLMLVGGGLGWVQLLLTGWFDGRPPLELYSPEAFTFLTIFSLPHLTGARLGWMVGLLAYLHGVRTGKWPWLVLASAGWFLSALMNAFYVAIAFLLIFLFAMGLILLAVVRGEDEGVQAPDVNRLALRALIYGPLVAIPSMPLVFGTLALTWLEPVYAVFGAQNLVLSPPVWDYLLAWGLWIPPAVVGWFGLRRRRPLLALWLVIWLAVVPVLLYVPYNLQRRFSEGIFWPLVALAVIGLAQLPWARVGRALTAALTALSLPSTVLLYGLGLFAAVQLQTPAFIPDYRVQAYAFLGETLEPRTLVVSSFEFGNALPAYAPVVAYLGHGPETVYVARKLEEVSRFYDARTGYGERERLWLEWGAPYFVMGPDEAAAYGGFDPTDVIEWRYPIGIYYAYEGVSVWSLDVER